MIVVNDASIDNTSEIARTIASNDKRIKVIDLSKNSGVASARNKGLEEASGKYIAFLDSDDLWAEDKLEQQISEMEARDLLVSYGAYRRIDENGAQLGIVQPPLAVEYKDLLKSNYIGNLTGMYNAQVLGKQFFSKLKHEDYVAWLALLKRAGRAEAVAGILGDYRVYSGSTSGNKLRAATWQWRIYRDSESLNYFASAWYMLCYVFNAVLKRI